MYRLTILAEALGDLASVPRNYQELIRKRVNQLEGDPRPRGAKKLHEGGYRVRQGPYRILYEVDDGALLVKITGIKPRGQAYR